MKERIIIRPMYITDANYRKGMQVAVIELTGVIVKKHFDNVYQYIPEDLKEKYSIYSLTSDEIDWKLAGY